MLNCKQFCCAPKATLDFIGNQHNPMTRRNRPQLAQNRPTIAPRQHDIQNRQVIRLRPRRVQSVTAIRDHIRDEPVLGQAFRQKGRRLRFIFDNQDAHRWTSEGHAF